MEEYFQEYDWYEWLKLIGTEDEARLTQHLQVPGIDLPSQAAQSIISRMRELKSECNRSSWCACWGQCQRASCGTIVVQLPAAAHVQQWVAPTPS